MTGIEEIKSAIIDREEEIAEKFKQEKIIERENTREIKKHLSTDAIVVLTGVRRCGKSILAFMLGRGEKCGYVNFEDERLALKTEELNKVLEAIYSLKGDVSILIFDEIQNITGWEKFVARLISHKKIIITGSNARLLSKELATYLTGRHLDWEVFPFSFREFLKLKGFKPNIYLTKDKAQIKNYLQEYLEKGGFPLNYKLGKLFLLETYRDIVERDVIQRYKIKYPFVLKEIAGYLITNFGQEISFNQLKNVLKVKSVHTIENYISYLQNAYLVFLLKRFSFKLKEQSLAPKKVYCIDIGLAQARGFKLSENKGALLENLVALELLRKLSSNRRLELYYWKDHQQREVDFVLKEGTKIKQLIQVTKISSRLDLKERELDSLIKASRELKCNNLLIITEDYEEEEAIKSKKIRYVPLWKWLIS
ncbi:MAG: ATP-binding protein [Nanoarchaeota archaeon]